MSKYKALDLEGVWQGELEARLIGTWDAKNKRPRYLVTNLPRADFTLEQVCDAYRLRWQVELMFKEWKSYTSLHAFDTSKANIAEGLIWAALLRLSSNATAHIWPNASGRCPSPPAKLPCVSITCSPISSAR